MDETASLHAGSVDRGKEVIVSLISSSNWISFAISDIL